MTYALADLNQMNQAAFTDALGEIFEHTPAIAHEAWHYRPFNSVASLHEAMVEVMQALPSEQQLALIQAHPDLATKTQMTAASVQEQSTAGLNRLSSEDYQTFQALNQAYRNKFQFPFIVAVKEHTKDSILAAFRQRLTHDFVTEQQTALGEIIKITWFRLNSLIVQ